MFSVEIIICCQWKSSYEHLFKLGNDANYDMEFLEQSDNMVREWENTLAEFGTNIPITNANPMTNTINALDQVISIDEIKKAADKLKGGKACGYDCVPNEVLKSQHLLSAFHELFNTCLRTHTIPSEWSKIVIKPIPKKGKDQPVPGNTRGINLISNIARLYTSVLNQRLQCYLVNGILNDEQSAYRKMRSCIELPRSSNSVEGGKWILTCVTLIFRAPSTI